MTAVLNCGGVYAVVDTETGEILRETEDWHDAYELMDYPAPKFQPGMPPTHDKDVMEESHA